MLDIFLILLLIVVTYDQTLVATTTLWGVPCFLGGVLCSMLAGHLLGKRWHSAAPELPQTPAMPAAVGKRARRLLLVTGVVMAVSQAMPVLATDSFKVSDRNFSLIDLAITLFRAEMYGISVTVIAGLLVLPWLAWLFQWCGTFSSAKAKRCQGIAKALRRWAMLDVFLLALLVFVAESKNGVGGTCAPIN
jgi:uncharacterized paraquat-inducible protein A